MPARIARSPSPRARRPRRGRRKGAAAVVATLCLIPLIGVLAFALDGGLMLAAKRRVQTLGDAAALAAAFALYNNASTDLGLDPRGVAKNAATNNIYYNIYDGVSTPFKYTGTITTNFPPKTGNFALRPGYAEVILTLYQPRVFGRIWGASNTTITVRSVARGTNAPLSTAGVITLDPSSAQSFAMSGSGHVITNSDILINSSSASAASATNSGYAKAANIRIAGGYSTASSGYFSGTIATKSAATSDPFSGVVTAPDATKLTTQPKPPTYGTYVMSPGIYNGGVTLGGGMTVTMAPGTYYMRGGGFNVGNGAKLSGSGVTIYVDGTGSSGLNFNGGGSISLSAPTTGTYAGLLYYQDAKNSTAIQFSNGSSMTLTGSVYAPSAAMTISGGAASTQVGSQVIVRSMNVSNNADIRVNYSASNVVGSKAIGLVE